MILLVAEDVLEKLPEPYQQLKKDLAAESWLVNELVVPRAQNWDSRAAVVEIRKRIQDIYNQAPGTLKPGVIFILGHVPLPRCGSSDVIAPDDHNENKGARGCDAFYADIDGLLTDTATYNPGGLATPLAVNLPGDFKWDQDFFPSDIEMGFGRVDFADLTELTEDEYILLKNYLDRMHRYRMVEPAYQMGQRSAFFYGYDNSNDGSYRSLINISGPNKVIQNKQGPSYNQWVKENGPFNVFMQDLLVPELNDWKTHGMDATVFSSDQSYWGFGDVPQPGGVYSRIRALLGAPSRCLVTLWTTTGINIFHEAGAGIPLAIAMKNVMNHNASNQYLEKPPQEYDAEEWLNWTHFAYYGGPTIRLYKVPPPNTAYISENAIKQGVLNWKYTGNTNPQAYQISRSTSVQGPFQTIQLLPGNVTEWLIENYQPGVFYRANAVQSVVNGCGETLFPGLGLITDVAPILSAVKLEALTRVSMVPNPMDNAYQLRSVDAMEWIAIYNTQGQALVNEALGDPFNATVDVSHLLPGTY